VESLEAAETPPQETPQDEIEAELSQDERVLDVPSLSEKLDSLSALIEDLQGEFERKIKYDESKERIIDRLHEQLQDYRADLHFKLIRPLVMGLIELHDDMHSLAAEGADGVDERQRKTMLSFAESIEELLSQNGVDAFALSAPEFVPRRQRSIYTVPTEEPAQDKLVAEHVRKGFRYEERILRPEIVATYRLTKPSVRAESSSSNEEEPRD
jgi:molecular chaperone GrpE